MYADKDKPKKSGSFSIEKIDNLVYGAVFSSNGPKETHQRTILELAPTQGIIPSSIQGLYEAAGKWLYHGITVPAINIRGITYTVARGVFRAAMKLRVGTFIFEIARSEIGYTEQRPGEYAACVLAAGIREGFRGPVFIQGDHFQVNQKRYSSEPDKELNAIKELIREAIGAGFLNIDIDASTLVDLKKSGLTEQQERNCQVTAEMTKFIRSIEPVGITVSIGGEIGEVGGRNSTVADLRAFMSGYRHRIGTELKGISKISVQTGTTHGGVVLPDGSMADVEVDFKTLEELSRLAREEYSLAGAVQHGASTLPDGAFDMFPKASTAEVHLATGFQNLIYDSPYFPRKLTDEINRYLFEEHQSEREPQDTDEQFLYKNRKRAFGKFKKEMWTLPPENLHKIGELLEERFSLIFQKLNVVNTVDLVNKFVVSASSSS